MRKGLKKNCVCTNILDMNMIKLKGKKSSQIAEEYGVTLGRVNQWARENDVSGVTTDNGRTVEFYLFDKTMEEAFKNRKVKPGPAKTEKPPKVPGKPGRPRKNPVEALDIAPKSGRGRPRKK